MGTDSKKILLKIISQLFKLISVLELSSLFDPPFSIPYFIGIINDVAFSIAFSRVNWFQEINTLLTNENIPR